MALPTELKEISTNAISGGLLCGLERGLSFFDSLWIRWSDGFLPVVFLAGGGTVADVEPFFWVALKMLENQYKIMDTVTGTFCYLRL
jgi:hypothetical protein